LCRFVVGFLAENGGIDSSYEEEWKMTATDGTGRQVIGIYS
jgi:hypothetical protein